MSTRIASVASRTASGTRLITTTRCRCRYPDFTTHLAQYTPVQQVRYGSAAAAVAPAPEMPEPVHETIPIPADLISRDVQREQVPTKPLTKMVLTPAERELLSSALRVNQAGELAATLIYTSQTPVILKSDPHLAPLMTHMYDQEASHLKTFNSLIAKHRVRPTAMTPIWRAAASFLGWSTAMISTKAAMACTEAVETVIGEHYNGQVQKLQSLIKSREEKGQIVDEELRNLIDTIRRIRDEELEHLDSAVEEGAKEAEAYPVLRSVVMQGCKGAIWVSERV